MGKRLVDGSGREGREDLRSYRGIGGPLLLLRIGSLLRSVGGGLVGWLIGWVRALRNLPCMLRMLRL